MGIDLPAFEFLLRAHAELGDFGRTIVLGRQRLLMRDQTERERYERVLHRYRPDLTLADIDHTHADCLIKALGGAPYHVMDNSAYEGADVIHDLNEPLPAELRGRYDTVIDIGTLEHVFNIGTGMKSMAELVAKGGQFLCLNVADNHLGHGFWQFGPEVFFRTFCPAHGFEPRLADLYHRGGFEPLRDPEAAGRRLPLKTPGYTYITFGARKTANRPVFADGWPVQADYVAAWTVFLAHQAARENGPEAGHAVLHTAIDNHPENPLYKAELAKSLLQSNPRDKLAAQLLGEARTMAPDHPGFTVAEPGTPRAGHPKPRTPTP